MKTLWTFVSSSIVQCSYYPQTFRILSSGWSQMSVSLGRIFVFLWHLLKPTATATQPTHTHADCRAFVIILLIDTNFQNKESRDAGVTYLRVICHWMKNAGARELRPLALISRDMCKSNSWMKAEQASRRWILKIPTLLLCTVMDRASNESSRSVKLYNDEEGGLPGWKWLLALSHLDTIKTLWLC